MPEETIETMSTVLFEDGGEDLDMMEIMTAALTRYMQVTKSAGPSQESMKAMVLMMEPATVENLTEIGEMIRNVTADRDPDGLVTFFDNDLLEQDEGSE